MVLATKQDFMNAWLSGRLGNRLRQWGSYPELLASGFPGPVSIRSRRPDFRGTQYHVPLADVWPRTLSVLEAHAKETLNNLYYGESAPDERLTLQGEFWDGEIRGHRYDRYVMYSRAKTQMKKALAMPLATDLWLPQSGSWSHEAHCQFHHQAEGLTTELLLQRVMNTNSYEDFRILREQYPDHVVEFSCYEHCLGDCPHRNTIIWEVRAY